jgi:DNA-binding helix-hairpin-helix protein with protein kinase domain
MVGPGHRVQLPRQGGVWRVGAVLGEGGQGAVYELLPETQTRGPLALKWYRAEAAHPEQRAALWRLTERPAPSEAFLWPIEVLDGTDGSFGYVMPLRPANYLPIVELLTGRVDAPFSTVIKLCMGLADSFLKLHAQGLCYRDISLGNVFFDPASGRPMVCDNDNVGIDGREPARVLGTARFMAPEIVRGNAQPSTFTDLFSLAVLIFYLLMFHHPLQGRRELDFACFDRGAEKQLFGADPLFIFDPVDESNAPDPTLHAAVLQYWPLYPGYVRADFVRAFTVGLHDPAQRVREGVWRAHLSRLLDGIVICACGSENLTDDGAPVTCWACRRSIDKTVRLRFTDRRVLVLNSGTRVTRHHLVRDYDFDATVGVVVAHPNRPGVWGLRNESATTWRTRFPGGSEQEVAPGRNAGLVPGARIDFGPAAAEIEL